jgi:hypothetical protein
MNAIQFELLQRWRETGDEEVKRPLLRSIAGIAAALRNTGRDSLHASALRSSVPENCEGRRSSPPLVASLQATACREARP